MPVTRHPYQRMYRIVSHLKGPKRTGLRSRAPIIMYRHVAEDAEERIFMVPTVINLVDSPDRFCSVGKKLLRFEIPADMQNKINRQAFCSTLTIDTWEEAERINITATKNEAREDGWLSHKEDWCSARFGIE